MGIIIGEESSAYDNGIYVVSAGDEVEKRNWDNELQKGGILMSTTVHISEHVADEHTKGSDDDEQIPKSTFHSRDVEKGLGWVR